MLTSTTLGVLVTRFLLRPEGGEEAERAKRLLDEEEAVGRDAEGEREALIARSLT